MRSRRVIALAFLVLSCLPACATTNGVRWAYGKDSVYGEPDGFSESLGARAIFGAPVIVGGAIWDVATWPLQVIFGVWPLWGHESTMMNPDKR